MGPKDADLQKWLKGQDINLNLSERDPQNTKIVIGLTGGVASMVSAYLLRQRGYSCIGIGIKLLDKKDIEEKITQRRQEIISTDIYRTGGQKGQGRVGATLEEDLSLTKYTCEETFEGIKRFCDSLEMPFYLTDITNEYMDRVINEMVAQRIQGRTFLPCLWCHSLKIEVLMRKAFALKADFVATGHFAKVHRDSSRSSCSIATSSDKDLDQSYLLSRLPNIYLNRLQLPLSELRLSDVQKLAERFNLSPREPVHEKKVCFMEMGNFALYVEKKANEKLLKKGNIVDDRSGIIQGEHVGIHYMFVGDKNYTQKLSKNTSFQNLKTFVVTGVLSTGKVLIGPEDNLRVEGAELIDLKLEDTLIQSHPIEVFIQMDLSNRRFLARLMMKNNQTAIIFFHEKQGPISLGQVFTFYSAEHNGQLLGSGVVQYAGDLNPLDRLGSYYKINPEDKLFNDDKDKDKEIEKIKEKILFRF